MPSPEQAVAAYDRGWQQYYQSGWPSVALGAYAVACAAGFAGGGRASALLAALVLLALVIFIYPRLYRLAPEARRPGLTLLGLSRSLEAPGTESALTQARHARLRRAGLLLAAFYAPWALLLVPGAAACSLIALIEAALTLLLLRPYLGLVWPVVAGAPVAAAWTWWARASRPACLGAFVGIAGVLAVVDGVRRVRSVRAQSELL